MPEVAVLSRASSNKRTKASNVSHGNAPPAALAGLQSTKVSRGSKRYGLAGGGVVPSPAGGVAGGVVPSGAVVVVVVPSGVVVVVVAPPSVVTVVPPSGVVVVVVSASLLHPIAVRPRQPAATNAKNFLIDISLKLLKPKHLHPAGRSCRKSPLCRDRKAAEYSRVYSDLAMGSRLGGIGKLRKAACVCLSPQFGKIRR